MKKATMLLVGIILLLLLLSACSNSNSTTEKVEEHVELTVSAAASLKNALDEIEVAYVKEHPEVSINYNFGGSGSLQQQISKGAPVDLFFSAAEDKLALLVDEGFIVKEDRVDLLTNSLVLIAPTDHATVKSFEDLTKETVEHISIGTVDTVPAGQYGKEVLEQLDVWNVVEPKVVYAKDVAQVLSYVETGNVEAGIVYKTDALSSNLIEIIAEADDSTHSPIIYPVGVIKDSENYEAARGFFQFLQSDAALKVFEEYGFSVK